MRASGQYPSPVHGVSTMTNSTVLYGYAKLQENFRSDPVEKLKRRPPLMHEGILIDPANGREKRHTFTRNEIEYEVLVREDGTVVGLVDNVLQTTTGTLYPYISDEETPDIDLVTINDTTFVLNRNRVVEMNSKTDQSELNYKKVSNLNVMTALNYGEVITLTIKRDGVDITEVEYEVPNIGSTMDNYDEADAARATAAVAEELTDLLSSANAAESLGISVWTKGSAVSIQSNEDKWLDVEVTSGQGTESIAVFNRVTGNTNGLPLYAIVDTVLQINPDPSTEKGAYFLKATRIAEVTPTAKQMEEVVWAETRDPDQEYSINEVTMPHVVTFDGEGGVRVGIPELGWEDRETGNNSSVKRPKFIGQTIKRLGYMQSRLLVLTGSNCVSTRVDDIYNFWKASSIKLLVTDPVSVASNATDIDTLEHLLPHNKDMLVTGANAQFKISGSTKFSPDTASMALTTTLEVDTMAKPVAMGNSIFFPTRRGESSGVLEYTGEKDTSNDIGNSVTDHIAGWFTGRITKLAANATNEMLFVQTDSSGRNILFVYEQARNAKNVKTQKAWSAWVFPDGMDIKDFSLDFNKLSIISLKGDKLWKHALYLEDKPATRSNTTIFLDNKILLSTDGTGVDLPETYVWDENTVVVRGDDAERPLFQVAFEYDEENHRLDFVDNIGLCTVHIGLIVNAKYIPFRPYRRDDEGRILTEEKIRIANVYLEVSDTYGVAVELDSKFYEPNRMEFSSEILGQAVVGVKSPYSGAFNYPFMKDADMADVVITAVGYLNINVTGIRWRGQYTKLTTII